MNLPVRAGKELLRARRAEGGPALGDFGAALDGSLVEIGGAVVGRDSREIYVLIDRGLPRLHGSLRNREIRGGGTRERPGGLGRAVRHVKITSKAIESRLSAGSI